MLKAVSGVLSVSLGLILFGDIAGYYVLPYVVLIPCTAIFCILLVIQSFIYLPTRLNFLFYFFLAAYAATLQIIKYLLPKGLQLCPDINPDPVDEEELLKAYRVTRVIQGVESSSGNAIMLASEKKNGQDVIIKYMADPNAEDNIGFSCSLQGDVAKLFPKTLRSGKVNTSRGEALFTVQTLASGEELDSWMASGRKSAEKLRAAANILQRARELTTQKFCHRDLHPGNIFVSEKGDVSFIDIDLGFSGVDAAQFLSGCQRFFFEMPLRLVAFSRKNLSNVEQSALAVWWVYMNAERYGEFTVDQLFMAANAFVVSKRFGILSEISAGLNNEDTWKKAEKAAKSVLNTYPPTSVVPEGLDYSILMYRFTMGAGQSTAVSPNVTIDPAVQTELQRVLEDFQKTNMLPRFELLGVVTTEFTTTVQINPRLAVTITIPSATNIFVEQKAGPVFEVQFKSPVTITSSGLVLNIVYLRVDKSSQIDTRYYVEGAGELFGYTFSIQDVVGEVVSPDGPLPTGNEVMALITSMNLTDEQLKELLSSFSSLEVAVTRIQDSGRFEFSVNTTDPENITITPL